MLLNHLIFAAKSCQIFNFQDRIVFIFKIGFFLIFNLILTERSHPPGALPDRRAVAVHDARRVARREADALAEMLLDTGFLKQLHGSAFAPFKDDGSLLRFTQDEVEAAGALTATHPRLIRKE